MLNFQTKGYEDLELSTQIIIASALERGIDVEILDRSDDFICLKKNGKVEYIKQATKTSVDNYVTALIMENKVVTKAILKENGFSVPSGETYTELVSALESNKVFLNQSIVIKPKSTNFGIGITILKKDWDVGDYEKAVKEAFSHDDSILIEAFLTGKEYRFLVVGDEVLAVLHRIPANIKGDGKSIISELIAKKNKHYFRGVGYKTPLEKIEMGKAEEYFLLKQGKDFMSIPLENELVYLRQNSNISTGGDSVDFTDEMGSDYKDIAIRSAKSVDAKICGVDMIIEDIEVASNKKNHGIIELNFNPVLYFHNYPYRGENRNVGEAVLDLLGFS